MKVGVVGLGKAGLPLAAVIAEAGFDVLGFDIDKKRVDDVNKNINPIPEEKELDGMLGPIKAATKYESCDAFIIIVPLFIDDNKKPDFSILDDAFSNVAGVLKDGDLVVLETTVPPGTTENRFKGILDKSGKKYHLAYSPERIMTGYSVSRYREFPKVVGGIDEESGEKALELYSKFCGKVSLVKDMKTAEMVKVCEGVYRDVNISLANELFKVCDKMGVDYYEVREAAKHSYCDLHLPGNVGGHCIPVYPWFLINDYDVPLIKTARLGNDDMIKYYASLVKGKKVLVYGITFREGVKELAYARSLPFIDLLKDKEVYVFDPMYTKKEIEDMGYRYSEGFSSMDTVVIFNKYKDPRLKGLKNVVDIKKSLK
jgi:UDP-N-acetyl-D-mannosaminuronic acid dehydrogenase